MSTETRFTQNIVHQSEYWLGRDPEMPSNKDTKIVFIHDKFTVSRWREAPEPIIYGPIKTSQEKWFVLLSTFKQYFKMPSYMEFMVEILSRIGAPEDERAAIIEKLFQVVEVAVPDHDIIVRVSDITLSFLDSASSLGPGGLTHFLWAWAPPLSLPGDDDRIIIDRDDSMESMEEFEPNPKLIPATKSFIEGLEKVRFDSLENSIRQMPCPIYWEGLDHFAVEQGTDEQLMISRLPCSHLYHGDCIVQWLERNHLCPMCRYAMPTVEVELEAGKPSNTLRRGIWDLLMMSAGGVLTTAACVGLQIIEAKLKVKISDHLIYAVPLAGMAAMYCSKLL